MRVRAFFWPLHGHRCLKQAVFFCSYDASSMSEQDEHSGTRVSGKKSVVLFYLYTFFWGNITAVYLCIQQLRHPGRFFPGQSLCVLYRLPRIGGGGPPTNCSSHLEE